MSSLPQGGCKLLECSAHHLPCSLPHLLPRASCRGDLLNVSETDFNTGQNMQRVGSALMSHLGFELLCLLGSRQMDRMQEAGKSSGEGWKQVSSPL